MALHVPDRAVIGQHVEAIHGPLERAAGRAAGRALADIRAKQGDRCPPSWLAKSRAADRRGSRRPYAPAARSCTSRPDRNRSSSLVPLLKLHRRHGARCAPPSRAPQVLLHSRRCPADRRVRNAGCACALDKHRIRARPYCLGGPPASAAGRLERRPCRICRRWTGRPRAACRAAFRRLPRMLRGATGLRILRSAGWGRSKCCCNGIHFAYSRTPRPSSCRPSRRSRPGGRDVIRQQPCSFLCSGRSAWTARDRHHAAPSRPW